MFTGIIQNIGTVKSIKKNEQQSQDKTKAKAKESFSMFIAHQFAVEQDPVILGESIAINGVCLTVSEIVRDQAQTVLKFDVSPETISKTSFSNLVSGSRVNLERALRLSDRLSGHIVQGHVDGVATLKEIEFLPEDYFNVKILMNDPQLLKYCVKKGSISLNGISLTIHEKVQNLLSFQIIPHTWKETILQDLKPFDLINVEVDMVAKYIESFANDQSKFESQPN